MISDSCNTGDLGPNFRAGGSPVGQTSTRRKPLDETGGRSTQSEKPSNYLKFQRYGASVSRVSPLRWPIIVVLDGGHIPDCGAVPFKLQEWRGWSQLAMSDFSAVGQPGLICGNPQRGSDKLGCVDNMSEC